ncbi:signal peptidase II, partial [Vibrio genomosp. F10]|uniref:signal peptidase II n=1 Tax=Vibrio genomosp. F10 TaxID=723171 RepID=UPI00036E4F3C
CPLNAALAGMEFCIVMKIWTRTLITSSVSFLLIGCDQTTKLFATQYLPKEKMDSYFFDLLRVGYTENIGAFLGLGNNLSEQTRFWVFVVVIGIFLAGLLWYLITNSKQSMHSLFALSLVFSGGVSNFYDRVVNNGAVIDFLNVGVGAIRTGIFNVADIAIMVGVFILLVSQMKPKSQ